MNRKHHIAVSLLVIVMVIMALMSMRVLPGRAQSTTRPEAHALWAHPPDVGKSEESVRQFIAQCQRANIDTIVILVKGMNGEIYWQSRKFASSVVKGYESFDMLGTLIREAHARNI